MFFPSTSVTCPKCHSIMDSRNERKWQDHLKKCGVTPDQMMSAIVSLIGDTNVTKNDSNSSSNNSRCLSPMLPQKRSASLQQPSVTLMNAQHSDVRASTVMRAKRACVENIQQSLQNISSSSTTATLSQRLLHNTSLNVSNVPLDVFVTQPDSSNDVVDSDEDDINDQNDNQEQQEQVTIDVAGKSEGLSY